MIALGMLVAFVAAVANASAAALQAAEDRRTPVQRRVSFSLVGQLAGRPRWVLGVMLMVVAWPLQVFALSLAPITVVQPTLATFPAYLLLFSRYGLHERVSRKDILGVIAIMIGIALVVVEAPPHVVVTPAASRLAAPLTAIGVGALLAYAYSSVGRRSPFALTIGAGLGYAWIDFADKLLSNSLSSSDWALSALWVVLILLLGALAFLQENAALQQRQAIQVSPLIGALQDPLPVLMALWSGLEAWGSSTAQIVVLALGLSSVVGGAYVLGRSGTAALAVRSEAPSRASDR